MTQSDLDNIAYNKFTDGEITLDEYIKYKNRDKIMEKKEAMKILKDFHDKSALFSVRTALDTIIPELKEPKESEDERIRKEIIYFLSRNTFQLGEDIDKYKSWIAWLEKQCESKSTNIVPIPDGCHAYIKNRKVYIENYTEAMPANKVEPKFHKGNWVILTAGELSTTLQIVNVDTNKKLYWFNDGSYLPIVDEECLRLWTIEDAKDGDVLHSIGFHSDCIFIFDGLDNWKFDEPDGERAVATGYCCLTLSADNMEFGIQGPDCIEVDTVKPATKIQRDLLFQKIKEAGYEWDAKKKELKKIKPKTLNADDVIGWLKPYECVVDHIVWQFKKDFGL